MRQIYATMPRQTLLIFLSLFAQALWAQGFQPCAPYGGEQAVKGLLEQEMRFPEHELRQGLKGSVVLIFSVMADGAVEDLRIWRSLTPACDAEALRLGRLVRWHPALLGATPHAAEHYLEVPFDAKRYQRAQEARRCPGGYDAPADSSLIIATPTQVSTPPVPGIEGGSRALPAYLGRNLRYPEVAHKHDIQGAVRLEFVIEPSGSISNLRALDELGGGCTEEAMRLVRSICWTPATKDDLRVRCIQRVDIRFQLLPGTER
jgi:TonB family protein